MNEKYGPVAEADVAQWHRSADVVVVGLGAAGACAALEAANVGADVLALERASGGGGASALSEGIFYLGGGTAVQQACGFHDDPDSMFRFLRASMSTDDEKLRAFCDGGVEHHGWLESHGVPFERRALKSKAVASHTGEGLLTTGNEYAYPFRDLVPPVPRGHQTTASEDDHGGAVAMRALLTAVERSSVRVAYDARVDALVIDSHGRVCGVQVRIDGQDQYVQAIRGVIIATGSFNCNESMTTHYLPLVSKVATPLGTPANDGAGIQLGLSVGATTENMSGALVTSSIYPPDQLIKGIVVNREGQRFTAEDVYHGRLGNCIEQQPDQVAYLILDEKTFAYPTSGRHPLVGVWETIVEAEEVLGLPRGALEETLNEYNSDVEFGEDRQFHKHQDWLQPLVPPFAAFDISFRNSGYNFIGLGGLRSNEYGQALVDSGEPLPGLYAVGACAAHLSANGAEYGSGLSLGPGSFFGRRAGRHAAESRQAGSDATVR
ncbi:FAD-dependent oxidoreductase [Nocardia neocaledoniensis]|uniref:FAD-dependent oxidoreductase n=1 Tax=Nocardia neocaledoniensis TaxID=236511 RepID=UPI0024564EE3|nr:FAD-dependent oxidoreductase [Nocardia neocaledoniensis]